MQFKNVIGGRVTTKKKLVNFTLSKSRYSVINCIDLLINSPNAE